MTSLAPFPKVKIYVLIEQTASHETKTSKAPELLRYTYIS
jgi:hypothetical protein